MPADRPSHDVPALALRLLSFEATGAEQRAWSTPPYPTPAGLVDDRRAVTALLDAVPAELDDRPAAVRPLTGTRPFAEERRLVLREGALFVPADAVCLLVVGGVLPAAEVDALVDGNLVDGAHPDRTTEPSLRRAVVLAHLGRGEVDAAVAASPAIGGYAFVGFRDVGAFHARHGDAPAFVALWKAYAAGKERADMVRLKRDLVRGVAVHHGWEAALEVTRDARIGPAFAADAFSTWAATGDVVGLLAGFDDDGAAAGVLSELDRLGVLVDALNAAAPREPLTDVDGVSTVFARLRAVDPTRDKATMRRRDLLLSRLWPAIGEQATLTEVRRAIRTPALRGELRRLARDVR